MGISIYYDAVREYKLTDEENSIIETDLPNFSVESSHGSHFFHNVTSMNIGYLSVSPGRAVSGGSCKDRFDWEWLKTQHCEKRLKFCVWSRTERPLNIVMDGRRGSTVIFKQ